MKNYVSYKIVLPENRDLCDQNQEYIWLEIEGERQKVRIHDYKKMFSIPKLYEQVVYRHLKCCSPNVLAGLMHKHIKHTQGILQPLRILDFGAGSGISGKKIRKRLSCEALVGLDILPEAKDSAYKEHPGIYDKYYIMDCMNLNQEEVDILKSWRFNTLFVVGALGFDDIPLNSFLNVYNLLEDNAWIAFNIKDRFLKQNIQSNSFNRLFASIFKDQMSVLEQKRYRHRYAVSGCPLYYYAIVGKKISNVTF